MGIAWTPQDVGTTKFLSGNITTLNWIAARSPTEVEAAVGYRPGRLSKGYFIALLQAPLTVADFELAGITLRSGGRLGLPMNNQILDQGRTSVMDSIKTRDGDAGYAALKLAALRGMTIRGPDRVAKVVPVERLGEHFNPAKEFPMGGGGAQWDILEDKKKAFFIAAFVNDLAQASFGDHHNLSISFDRGVYAEVLQNKTRLAQYLAQV